MTVAGRFADPPTSIPEPSTLAILGAGVLGLLAIRRYRTQLRS